MPVIDNEVRDLVARLEAGDGCVDTQLRCLISRLKTACSRADVVRRYELYREHVGSMKPMASDAQGYAVTFDPVSQEEEFFQCWVDNGIVASPAAISPLLCARSIERMRALLKQSSGGACDLDRPETWDHMPKDEAGVPLLSRGFFEIYHDDMLAQLRQSVRVYLHFVLVWGRAELWTTFDRLGVKLPEHPESQGLPLHVDQNPNVHPDFRTVQGVLALTDCPAERGTFVGVPGSKSVFSAYGPMARNKGEYVELDLTSSVAAELQAQQQLFPLREGSLISWDSRTTHANSTNRSDQTRMVAYISAGPARESDAAAVSARQDAFISGLGSNVRDALMHASRKPRFTSPDTVTRVRAAEELTLLGRLLYGQCSYGEIAPSAAS